MRKTYKVILLLAVILLVVKSDSFSQTIKLYENQWFIPADTANTEEQPDRMSYNEKSNFFFSIANDEKFLYINIIPGDETLGRKIVMFGLTSWFDPSAKKKKDKGIVFPLAEKRERPLQGENGNDRNSQGSGQERSGDRNAQIEKMLVKKNEKLVLLGFGEDNDTEVIDLAFNDEYKCHILSQDGRLQIQMKLPLEAISPELADGSLDKLSIGFETGYLDMSQQRSMNSMDGRPGGGGGGGGRMGGPPGGGGQERSGGMNMQAMTQPTKLWLKEVRLKKIND